MHACDHSLWKQNSCSPCGNMKHISNINTYVFIYFNKLAVRCKYLNVALTQQSLCYVYKLGGALLLLDYFIAVKRSVVFQSVHCWPVMGKWTDIFIYKIYSLHCDEERNLIWRRLKKEFCVRNRICVWSALWFLWELQLFWSNASLWKALFFSPFFEIMKQKMTQKATDG